MLPSTLFESIAHSILHESASLDYLPVDKTPWPGLASELVYRPRIYKYLESLQWSRVPIFVGSIAEAVIVVID